MKQADCQYYQDGCALGYYGGKPEHKECYVCRLKGEDNPECAEALFRRREKSHPSGKPRVSGCCDDARNP